MDKTAVIEGQEIAYSVRKNTRGRRLRVSVYPGGRCVVSMPRYMPERAAIIFMRKNAEWLLGSIQRLRNKPAPVSARKMREHFEAHKAPALAFLKSRVDYFSRIYGFSVRQISIRNQRTRWGSCSRNGSLSLNYRLHLLPQACADYVVVHELCHLQEFNHSQKFWVLVANVLPDYKNARKELRRFAL